MLSFFICNIPKIAILPNPLMEQLVLLLTIQFWTSDAALYATSPYSYHGNVPIIMGDTIERLSLQFD